VVSGSQRVATADTFDPVGFVQPHPGAARLTIDPERAISHMPGRFFPAEFKFLHSLPSECFGRAEPSPSYLTTSKRYDVVT
jgi:hypothetical protein